MTDEPINTQEPTPPAPTAGEPPQTTPETPPAAPPTNSEPPRTPSSDDDPFTERLERLGGEPAPVITPEEFARLQRAGQVHIDARGRVRTARRSDAEAGVSLRKRRAWYVR